MAELIYASLYPKPMNSVTMIMDTFLAICLVLDISIEL
jgi:hypothetical protein